jgi:hypothetical protein
MTTTITRGVGESVSEALFCKKEVAFSHNLSCIENDRFWDSAPAPARASEGMFANVRWVNRGKKKGRRYARPREVADDAS